MGTQLDETVEQRRLVDVVWNETLGCDDGQHAVRLAGDPECGERTARRGGLVRGRGGVLRRCRGRVGSAGLPGTSRSCSPTARARGAIPPPGRGPARRGTRSRRSSSGCSECAPETVRTPTRHGVGVGRCSGSSASISTLPAGLRLDARLRSALVGVLRLDHRQPVSERVAGEQRSEAGGARREASVQSTPDHVEAIEPGLQSRASVTRAAIRRARPRRSRPASAPKAAGAAHRRRASSRRRSEWTARSRSSATGRVQTRKISVPRLRPMITQRSGSARATAARDDDSAAALAAGNCGALGGSRGSAVSATPRSRLRARVAWSRKAVATRRGRRRCARASTPCRPSLELCQFLLLTVDVDLVGEDAHAQLAAAVEEPAPRHGPAGARSADRSRVR